MTATAVFAPGERVVDRDTEIDGEDPARVARVRDVLDEPARDHYINAINQTVADVNPSYPPDDRVVRVVFEDGLNHYVADAWREWSRETFVRQLERYERQWTVRVPTYSYPASRLKRLESNDMSTTE